MVQPINVRAINQGLRRWPINSTTNLGAGSGLSAYAVNGSDPATVADFAGTLNSGTPYFRVGGSTSSFASMFSFSRASAGYYLNSSGVWTSASSGTARTGHYKWNGSSWVRAGILLESAAATNLLLNSNTLSTQGVSVTAQAYTLSFSGTGTVTLSGASTAGPLVGTGTGEQNRVRLTFTPSAGTLTLTVSGTVSNAQLEAGSVPTSYIPTTGATATRAAETLTIAGSNMAASTTAMSFQMQGEMSYADNNTAIDFAGNGAEVNFFRWRNSASSYINNILYTSAGTGDYVFQQESATPEYDQVFSTGDLASPGLSQAFNFASRHTSSAVNGAIDGTALTADETPTTLPDLSADVFALGHKYTGTIALFRQWDVDLTDSGIESASS